MGFFSVIPLYFIIFMVFIPLYFIKNRAVIPLYFIIFELFIPLYSCSKITSVCRMLISMSPEKIICVHLRNLREINTMNNPRVKKIFFVFLSVILSFYYVTL